jgi:hypothetical protein
MDNSELWSSVAGLQHQLRVCCPHRCSASILNQTEEPAGVRHELHIVGTLSNAFENVPFRLVSALPFTKSACHRSDLVSCLMKSQAETWPFRMVSALPYNKEGLTRSLQSCSPGVLLFSGVLLAREIPPAHRACFSCRPGTQQ